MNLKTLQHLLAPNPLIRRFYCYGVIDSTMDQARRLIGSSDAATHHGTLIVADHQTSGKGRHGRSWDAPPGMALLATLIMSRSQLPAAQDKDQLSMLACAIPVAVCRGVNAYVKNAGIKYPNDIVANGRKLGGILIEACGDAVLVGFGVNCNQALDDFPYEMRMPASSTFLETGRFVEREEVLQAILFQMNETLTIDFISSVDEMNDLCETLGRTVCIDVGDKIITGIAQAIAADGRLIIDTDAGQESVFSSQVIRTWRLDGAKEVS